MPQPDHHLPPPGVLVRNRCDPALIDHRFMPLIASAIAAYRETLPYLVDIRLQGSVARGEAIIGQSDVDLMALVDQAPDERALTRLQDEATRLLRRFPVVSRVELDVASLSNLLPFQRLALSSDSLSVYGEDTLTQREQRVDRLELARLVTPDAAALVADYRTPIEEAIARDDDQEIRFWSRLIGKDLLKVLRALILLRGGEYEVSIDRIYGQIGTSAPEFTGLADRLYRLYRAPDTDSELALATLDEAAATLLPALANAW